MPRNRQAERTIPTQMSLGSDIPFKTNKRPRAKLASRVADEAETIVVARDGLSNNIGNCVVPHGALCSGLYCFSGPTILMFIYKVVMLAPDRWCSFC
jgi:hypothetical protein